MYMVLQVIVISYKFYLGILLFTNNLFYKVFICFLWELEMSRSVAPVDFFSVSAACLCRYFLDMSIESTMSLSFGIGLVVKPLISPGFFSVVVAGRSVTKLPKSSQSPSAMTERDVLLKLINFFFFCSGGGIFFFFNSL